MASVAKLSGGVETEAVGRADDVVVDRLGDADERDPHLREPVRDRQRAVAAEDHQGVEAHPVEHLDDPGRVVLLALGGFDGMHERVAAVDGAEDGPAPPQDAGDVTGGEHPGPVGLEQPVEAVLETDDLDAVIARRT